MNNKQLFAKVGVFVLLGVNVAAYYFIWPHKDGASKTEARVSAQEKGETQLFPVKKDDKPSPATTKPTHEISASVWTEAKPLDIPKPAETPVEKANGDELFKLLEHIKNEADASKPRAPVVPAPSAGDTGSMPVPFSEEKKPNRLPPLPADLIAGERKDTIVGASASMPKAGPSPWLVNMETIGGQTQLIARLRARPNVEFKILSDRVEMKAPSGAVQALGRVIFTGPGIKGTCQRLIIPLHETQLVFEVEAHILATKP